MGLSEVGVCTKLTVLLALVAVVLDIVALATPKWENNDFFNSGLWEVCKEGKSARICGKIPDDLLSDKFEAVRALIIAGCALGVIYLLLLFLFILKVTTKALRIAVCITGALAGIVTLIGFCIYTSVDRYKYGYSFIVSIVASVMYFLTALFIGLDKKTNTSSYQGI